MTATATSPPSLGARSIRTILLATDLSAASGPATGQALELARTLGGNLLIVSVIDPGSLRLPGRPARRMDQVRHAREAAAAGFVQHGRAVGVPTRFLIWEGDPAEAIVEAAIAEGADMIVVGTHGRRGVGRFIAGSVSDQVVLNARCPVLVVRGIEPPGATG